MCRLVDDLMTRTQELLQPNPGIIYTVILSRPSRPVGRITCLAVLPVCPPVYIFFICPSVSYGLLSRKQKGLEKSNLA